MRSSFDACDHCAKLEAHESLTEITDALLPKQNRPLGGKPDDQSDTHHHWQQNRRCQNDERNIQHTLPARYGNRLPVHTFGGLRFTLTAIHARQPMRQIQESSSFKRTDRHHFLSSGFPNQELKLPVFTKPQTRPELRRRLLETSPNDLRQNHPYPVELSKIHTPILRQKMGVLSVVVHPHLFVVEAITWCNGKHYRLLWSIILFEWGFLERPIQDRLRRAIPRGQNCKHETW